MLSQLSYAPLRLLGIVFRDDGVYSNPVSPTCQPSSEDSFFFFPSPLLLFTEKSPDCIRFATTPTLELTISAQVESAFVPFWGARLYFQFFSDHPARERTSLLRSFSTSAKTFSAPMDSAITTLNEFSLKAVCACRSEESSAS